MSKPFVFLIGPINTGKDISSANINEAFTYGNKIRQIGCLVYIPHFHHFWNITSPDSEENWISYGHEIISACNAVFLMSGWYNSNGSKKDVNFAREIGKPVFDRFEDLERWAKQFTA